MTSTLNRIATASKLLPKDLAGWNALLVEALALNKESLQRPPHFCMRNLATNAVIETYPIPKNISKSSAVLVLLSPCCSDNSAGFAEVNLLLTMRTSRLRSHAGQMSFPGGRCDGTETPQDAACRECFEEVGIDRTQFRTIGQLQPVFSYPSKSWVTPVVAISDHPVHPIIASPDEVDSIYYLHLSPLLCSSSESHHQMAKHFSFSAGGSVMFPCFLASDSAEKPLDSPISADRGARAPLASSAEDWGLTPVTLDQCDGALVWGLTALMICELLVRLSSAINRSTSSRDGLPPLVLQSSPYIIRDPDADSRGHEPSKL